VPPRATDREATSGAIKRHTMRAVHSWATFTTVLLGLALAPSADLGAQKRDRDVITREELQEVAARSPSLLQAVRTLRSHMVDTSRGASRGVRSMDVSPPGRDAGGAISGLGTTRNTQTPTPILYLDGTKVGHLTLMRDILTTAVEEVRYLNPNRAMGELGLGHEGGAIMVKMYKPEPP